jgi:hypothetical protein
MSATGAYEIVAQDDAARPTPLADAQLSQATSNGLIPTLSGWAF